jgi:xanthine dehydrogenase small subunit
MRDQFQFFLNGREQIVRGDSAFITLAEYLRLECGLVGTKVVCAEGDCGACTVLVGRPNSHPHSFSRKAGTGESISYVPIDACIQFLFQVDGTHVVTIEGLPSNGDLHPAQQAMVDHHGSQCGYCTPGFVMALAGCTENGGHANNTRIALTGNLCRCTGYLPILEAAATIIQNQVPPIGQRFDSAELLSTLASLSADALHLATGTRTFVAPTTLSDSIAFKAANPDTIIIAGATELGVLRNKHGFEPIRMMSLARVPDLGVIESTPDRMSFGANVTWAQVEAAVGESLPQFHRIVERFGSPQIRHVATLVGNVAHGSPIADSLPLLSVMDAELEIAGANGIRRRSINGFYTGYKKKDLRDDELITRVILPLAKAGERLRLYKVSRRTDLDIATFGAAIRIRMEGSVIGTAAVAYSGVAPTLVRLPRTEAFLCGKQLNETTFLQAGRVARNEVTPITDVRGSADFRLQLCENVLRKFYFDDAEIPAEAMA